MSENIPESIPTSSSRTSHRPTKKRALNTPLSQQSASVEALFANPDREINIPSTSTALSRSLAPPPEIVTNVQGSSAGAGSGEFHVYKASRRREYERLRVMDEEVEREEADKEFEASRAEVRRKEEEVLARNRAKREKAKMRASKKGKGGKGGGEDGGMEVDGVVKKKVGARKIVPADGLGGEGAADAAEGNGQAVVEDGGGITFHDDD
ncbi:hypothetical protein LTR56_019700 [Elasticomyces elasticus]|nr:hypothetical protein LTR56_019700 [Elasticomyces elasticus]KAK3634001.1 hypothetical protein LTR22_019868 [Elasticomyces elasticus]KAK4911104.1 hypothetical protein LTR49_020271 [Elasticomyces elasticus]KAK5750668.1 hypothetical protein LTS12_019289 [Elasticomyces elasticus]